MWYEPRLNLYRYSKYIFENSFTKASDKKKAVSSTYGMDLSYKTGALNHRVERVEEAIEYIEWVSNMKI